MLASARMKLGPATRCGCESEWSRGAGEGGKPARNLDSSVHTLISSPRFLEHSHAVAQLPLVAPPETAAASPVPPTTECNTESSLSTQSHL